MPDNPDNKINNNLLLQTHDLFPFQLLQSTDILPAAQQRLQECEKLFEEIEKDESSPTWENTISLLEDLDTKLSDVFIYPQVYLSVNNQKDFRTAIEQAQQMSIPLYLRMNQSKILYQRLKNLQSSKQYTLMSSAQKIALDNRILALEISGVHLSEDKKNRFTQLQQKFNKLRHKFTNNILDRTKSYEHIITDKNQLTGIPESGLVLLSENYKREKNSDSSPEKGPWLIKLDPNTTIQILNYADDRSLRQITDKNYSTLGSHRQYDNTEVVEQTIILRQELAELIGYPHYAAVSLANKMANSVEEIIELQDKIKAACIDYFDRDIEAIKKWKATQGDLTALAKWDINYWTKKYIKAHYDYDMSLLREYLPYRKVLKGLFDLIAKLFSVELRLLNIDQQYLWHKDVECYQIIDQQSNKSIARLFLDPFSRPGLKNPGAWMFGTRNAHCDSTGKFHQPIAVVVCNFWPPTESRDSLLSFGDMSTLFHEFGHALQQTLSTVKIKSVSGTSVKWDIVELPSQFMENWCFHQSTVQSFAKHYKTDEVLPDSLFAKIKASKNFGKSMHYLSQIIYSSADLKVHSQPEKSKDFEKVYKKLVDEVFSKHWEMTDYSYKMLQNFKHIFAGGYAAGYYSYLWAEIISADAFDKFENVGLDNLPEIKKIGMLFRNTILALGGSEEPSDIYRKFAGRDATIDSFLKHNGFTKNK